MEKTGDPFTDHTNQPYEDIETREKKLPELLAELSAVRERKERLEAELKETNKEFDRLRKEDGPIVQEFVKQGVKNIKLVNGQRANLTTVLFANKKKGLDAQMICAEMEKGELADLVKPGFATQSLKSYISERLREMDENEEEYKDPVDALPENLRQYFNVLRETQIRLVGKATHKED